QEALGLTEPPHIVECFDISNISTTHKVASMVCFATGKPDRSNYRRYRIRTVEGQDDFASMAEVVRRRYSRVLTEGIRKPSLIVVDGGKGQLRSARKSFVPAKVHRWSSTIPPARSGCSSASATRRTASPTATTRS